MMPVAVNDWEVLKPEDLLPVYQRAQNEGKRVMAVVANACATATGYMTLLMKLVIFVKKMDLVSRRWCAWSKCFGFS